jgi:short chain dehydrogenase
MVSPLPLMYNFLHIQTAKGGTHNMIGKPSSEQRGEKVKLRLKSLDRQTIVITGASSGIGLVTARMAAKRGASLVLAARNKDALMQLTEEIQGQGGNAEPIQADVGREEGHRRHRENRTGSFWRVRHLDQYGGAIPTTADGGTNPVGMPLEIPSPQFKAMK